MPVREQIQVGKEHQIAEHEEVVDREEYEAGRAPGKAGEPIRMAMKVLPNGALSIVLQSHQTDSRRGIPTIFRM